MKFIHSLCLLSLLPCALANGNYYYGVRPSGDLLKIDLDTNVATTLGNIGRGNANGAATTPDGELLTIIWNGGNMDLGTIHDPLNPASTTFINLTPGPFSETFSGLAVSCSGVVYFCNQSGQIGTIDRATGDVTIIGNAGSGLQALAFAPDGKMYANRPNGQFGSIDLLTAQFTLIGNSGDNFQTLQWDYVDGNRFLASSLNNRLYTIDPLTAATALLPPISNLGPIHGMGPPVREACCANACGDPHFNTWSGNWYDFHGICDLVLLSAEGFSSGLGLDIHIRTKPRYEYSYIEAAAIKIGDDVLEVGSWGDYMVNGVRDAGLPFAMGGQFPVHHEIVNKKRAIFRIQTGENEAIVINTHKDLVNVNLVNATSANFATSSGMMGKFQNGALVARDGVTIMDDHNLFGQEWQVKQSDGDLFQSPSPHEQCVPPSSIRQSRRLGETTVSEEAAAKACAHHEDKTKRDLCEFDVIAMSDLEVTEIHGAY